MTYESYFPLSTMASGIYVLKHVCTCIVQVHYRVHLYLLLEWVSVLVILVHQ